MSHHKFSIELLRHARRERYEILSKVNRHVGMRTVEMEFLNHWKKMRVQLSKEMDELDRAIKRLAKLESESVN